MKGTSYLDAKFDLKLAKPDYSSDTNIISYTQFSAFLKCPLYWKLSFKDKLRSKEPSIHIVFGNAMHRLIQEWLITMFTQTIKASNEMNFDELLLSYMKEEYMKEYAKVKVHFVTSEQMVEFYIDGLETLKWLRKKRKAYFNPKQQELIGIELPLMFKVNDKVEFVAYLDVVLRDKLDGKIIIPDLKTSGKGWSDYDKKDHIKVSQLVLYKYFFAQQYNIPIDNIEIEYMILKRKVITDQPYPIRRVQTFKPSQGSITINKIVNEFNSFVHNAFSEPNYTFPATGGNACRFCEFRDNYELCPLDRRMSESYFIKK